MICHAMRCSLKNASFMNIFAVTLLTLVTSCTIPRAVDPPKAKRLSSFAPTSPLQGRVRVVALGEGRLDVVGNAFKSRADFSSYYANVKAWSEHFARILAAQFARRGVDTTSGPTITVTLTNIAAHKRAFYRVQCRLGVKLSFGTGSASEKTFTSEHRVSLNAKRRCIADAYKDLVAQIMNDPGVTSLVRSGR